MIALRPSIVLPFMVSVAVGVKADSKRLVGCVQPDEEAGYRVGYGFAAG
jgi:hypothetical protein